MLTLKDYVNWGITHCDKTASAEGVPLVMENCLKNKKMKQLEVYGNSVQNGTPSPEAPVEVESVGEKCTKNLFDAESYPLAHGYYIGYSNGTYNGGSSIANCATPSYIPCNEMRGKTYTLNYVEGNNTSISFYDADKKFISSVRYGLNIGVVATITFIVPDDAYFYRFTASAKHINEIQIEEGSVATEYEPYGKYKIPVTVRGKNLFMPTVVSAVAQVDNPTTQNNYGTTIDSVDLTDNSVTVAQVANPNYTADNYTNGYFSIETDGLEIGKTYKVSFDVDIKENPLNASRIGVFPSGQYPISWGGFTESTQRVSCTFTHKTHPDGRPPYLEIRCMGMSFTASNFMITEEGQDDTYEPYIEPQTTNVYLNEPLLKIGDYADVIDFKGKKVVRNMRELVFDGAESWGLLGTGDANLWGFMLYIKSPYLRATSYAADCSLCNMYPVVKSRADKTLSGQSSSRNRFDFIDLDYADVDAWKAHLAELSANGTPIKIVYALELPYEELIDCELPTLNAKTTVIDIDTSILPSNIKGKYIKR